MAGAYNRLHALPSALCIRDSVCSHLSENVIAHHSAVEIDPRDAKSPPQRRGSIAEHPLNKLSVHELRQLLDARQIKYDTCRDKDDLVQLAIDRGLTNERPATAESGQQSGASA